MPFIQAADGSQMNQEKKEERTDEWTRQQFSASCVMDMDGTLLNSRKETASRTREALKRLQQQGTRLVLASSCPESGFLPVFEQAQTTAAMGNSPVPVQRAAVLLTDTDDDDGIAETVEMWENPQKSRKNTDSGKWETLTNWH